MHSDVQRILYSEQELSAITDRIAEKINEDYQGRQLVVVGILKGSVVFLADLFRKLTVDCTLDFMAASSYGNSAVSSGEVKITKDISTDIRNKDVLIVEDILDTGNTLSYIKKYLGSFSPSSVKICTLFDKPCRRLKPITPDYYGAAIEDLFIVGYGLDYAERYRNLPYVGVLKPETYNLTV